MHAPDHMNLTVYQGATFEHVHTCLDERGAPLDFTDATAKLQAKADDKANPILTLTTGSGITLTPTTGTITLTIPATTTAGLPPGPWRYDLLVTWLDGTKARCLAGTITVDPAITT